MTTYATKNGYVGHEIDGIDMDGQPFSVATLRAMHAALERLDPTLIPGLTAAERRALSRYARPAAEQPLHQVTPDMRTAADKARNEWLSKDANDQIGALNAALDAAFSLVEKTHRRVRHIKTGGEYTVLGDGEVQLSVWHDKIFDKPFRRIYEGDTLTVYHDDKGKLWLRFPDEFSDGRFEDLNYDENAAPPEAEDPVRGP